MAMIAALEMLAQLFVRDADNITGAIGLHRTADNKEITVARRVLFQASSQLAPR
jgi:hypothetical protein